ncbi:MAG: nitrous oxide reductase accessory protein NosL [Balneolaceae bacterium]|nr:nitrous oxide reductase accessory protein NosL [Balneolaceae bacterium]
MKSFIRLLILFGFLMSACSQKPAEIHYGSDECEYCKMMIHDNRFASQIITETGKSIKFDAIECMAAYTTDHKSELNEAKYWVSDFSSPDSWVEISEATIIQSEVIKSPMGASLLAIGNEQTAEQHLSEYPGEIVAWETLVK